ncbi:MAG: hypothetical protein ABF238_00030 [Flavobacteriales bacterium]
MGGLTLSNKTLEKYFGYLKTLDIKSKKSLISKLKKSMEKDSKNNFDLKTIFGKWEDTRASDEIIEEIQNSRVEKGNSESFG